MNKDVYPQDVDFDYKVRCSQHNFKPYVYCEMCMVRSKLQSVLEDARFMLGNERAQVYIALNDMRDLMDKQTKKIAELQIEVNLLKGATPCQPNHK